MSTEIQILIADDHPIVRQGLRQTIEAEPSFRVVGEAGDGQEALEMIQRLAPQVAVLDIDMPRMDGFAVARALHQAGLEVKLIFLTVHREESYLKQALSLGASGYVLKDSAITDIVAGLRAVIAGQSYLSPLLTSYLMNQAQADAPEQPAGLSSLTGTERQVLRLIAEYKTTRDIAEALAISPFTVETHRKNISRKLELRGSHALMKYALAHQADLLADLLLDAPE